MNILKTFMLAGSYVQLKSVKNMLFTINRRIPAPGRSLKSSNIGADITLAGRPFQKWTVDGKKKVHQPNLSLRVSGFQITGV